MTGEEQFGWRPWPKALRRCRAEDVLIAFRVVGRAIRVKHRRVADGVPTQADVCQLALRIKDQRDLIRQLTGRHNRKHARRLLRLNRKHRLRLLRLVEQAGLDPSVLIFR
ncbi:MAG: hypothetical protein V3R99_09470 [Thermoguttaceae bacterium]